MLNKFSGLLSTESSLLYIALVLLPRIELGTRLYQSRVIPLYYKSIQMVPPPGFDPGSLVLQTSVITISTKAAGTPGR